MASKFNTCTLHEGALFFRCDLEDCLFIAVVIEKLSVHGR